MSKKLLRKKLALMLANLKKKRKYYCEVEYLETTNQQSDYSSTNAAAYIDTGIIPNDNTKLECRMQFTTLISGQSKEALNGTTATGQETAPRFAWGFASLSPYTNFYFGLGAQNLTTSVTRDTNVHTFVLDAKNKTCSIDNTTNSFTSSGSVDSTRSIYLFARHATADYANKPCNEKIYCCKIYDNETIVRDFIPVLDWNYVPCLYDKVSGQLFYSQGTGEFTTGREIHYVDYLESTGTQYIDTGIVGTNENMGIDVTWAFSNNDENMCIFSSRSAQTSNSFTLFWLKTASNRIRFDTTGQPYFANGVNASVSDDIFNFNYKSAEGAIATLTNKTTEQIQTLNTGKLTTFSTNNLYLFASRDTGTVGSWIKMYNCQIYDSNTLVRDYAPMVDEQGVGAMFDRVTHTIYDNAGTGAFAYPPVELEYLESTGTQYIDTGVGGDLTTELTCEAAIVQAGNASVTNIMGNNVTNTRAITINMSANVAGPSVSRIRFGNTDNTTVAGAIDLNTFYKYDTNKNELTVRDSSGTVLNTYPFNATTAFTTNGNILIYKLGDGNTQYIGKIKVKGATIKNSGVLVRDFMPCYKDGVACMVDKLTGTAYLNQGTGSFAVGRILEPEYE